MKKFLKLAEISQLLTPRKSKVQIDEHYAAGFKAACEKRNIEPAQVLEVVKLLELPL